MKKKARPLSRLDFQDYEEWIDANTALRNSALLEATLLDGSKHPEGIRLVPAECHELLSLLRDAMSGKSGRPRASPEDECKMKHIAAYSTMLELDMHTKAAIDRTKEVYGIKRTTVYTARQRFRPEILSNPPDWMGDSSKRRLQRIFFEAFAADFFQGQMPEDTAQVLAEAEQNSARLKDFLESLQKSK